MSLFEKLKQIAKELPPGASFAGKLPTRQAERQREKHQTLFAKMESIRCQLPKLPVISLEQVTQLKKQYEHQRAAAEILKLLFPEKMPNGD